MNLENKKDPQENKLMVAGWWGGIFKEYGMDRYTLLSSKWVTIRDLLYRAQETQLNVLCKPGWEQSLGENGYMYMYGRVPSLSTWNYHSVVNQLCVLVAHLCPILWDPKDCSPPSSSVHGILQARILEWLAIPFSRESSWPRDWTWVFCIAGRFFFTVWTTREALPHRPHNAK